MSRAHRWMQRRTGRAGVSRTGAAALALAGCSGPQSALAPASAEAARLAGLWWWMAAGALVIWALVVAVAWYAIRARRERHSERAAKLLIIGGGAVAPTVVLGALLVYSLAMMPPLRALPADDALRVEISGEQWWWRVRYHLPGREPFESANELRLPVGRRTELVLTSPDVIHSFWVPSLAGKLDMIPGRVTRMALEPDRTGVFRGACAEYCGASHALMSLYAVVMEAAAFDAWAAREAGPAAGPAAGSADPLATRGGALFQEHGCGACHAIRGTAAGGAVGPDLTHVGGRVSLAAGVLPNEAGAFVRWIAAPESVKPGAHMPAFGMLPDADIRAIAAYLDGLE